MVKIASTTELRKMSAEDLHKELSEQRTESAKMKMKIRMGVEKDSAKYGREKKQIARMLTVLNEMRSKAQPAPAKTLKTKAKKSKLPAPSAH